MHDAYIGGSSENNIKCAMHDDLGWKNQTTQYILLRQLLYEWFSQFHSCGTYSVLSRSPSVIHHSRMVRQQVLSKPQTKYVRYRGLLRNCMYLKFESMRFDRGDLENRQRLNELLWFLTEDGVGLEVPGGSFQEKTVRKTACDISGSRG